MKTGAIKMLAVIAAITFSVTSCKKKEKDDFETSSANDNAFAEGAFNDIGEIANQASIDGSLSTYRSINEEGNFLSPCATITFTPVGNGGQVTIEFQSTPTPCLCSDGRYRKGTITVDFNGPYRDSGTVITTRAIDYYVGQSINSMIKINGTRTVTNMGRKANNNLWYAISVSGTFVDAANHTMTWSSTRQREWIAGENTPTWIDDEYLITGSASGRSFAGVNYTITITQALHVKLNCRWIVAGKFELAPEDRYTRYVDFGDGTCDGKAIVTIDGRDYEIILR